MENIQTNSIKAWILAARPKTLAAAATPVLLGCALAYTAGTFQWIPAILCFLFAFSMQIDANFINDYYDYLNGKESLEKLYHGEYMAQYSFAEVTNAELFAKAQKKYY